jgi:hypothetical protein
VSKESEGPPRNRATDGPGGGLDVSPDKVSSLASLPLGARLVLRCRKDWRDATVVATSWEAVTLSVMSPRGRTYRLRRPPDSPIYYDGSIPILGEGPWRMGLARYDTRW